MGLQLLDWIIVLSSRLICFVPALFREARGEEYGGVKLRSLSIGDGNFSVMKRREVWKAFEGKNLRDTTPHAPPSHP